MHPPGDAAQQAPRLTLNAFAVVFLLIAFILRVWNLASQSIWWDEAFTWQTTGHGWQNLGQMLLAGDRNPPLYFLSVTGWGGVAGWNEFSLRFVSVIWSMIGLAFVFSLTKRLYNRSAGVWALGLAAISPALVVYAQEARMYSAFFALTAATLYFGWRILEFGSQGFERRDYGSRSKTERDQKLVWVFLLCEAGLLLTHYFAIPIVAAINLFALAALLRRHARFSAYCGWIGGQLLAALPLFLWVLNVLNTPGSLIATQESPPDVFEFVRQVGTLWLTGVRDLKGEWLVLIPFAAALFLVVTIGAWRAHSQSTRWIIGFWLVSLAAAYLMAHLLTSFHPRYVLPYGLPIFLLAGGALSQLSVDPQPQTFDRRVHRMGRVMGGLTLVAIGLLLIVGWQIATSPVYAKDDARGVAAYLRQYAMLDDVILLEANDYTLNFYDHGPAPTKMITATTESDALRQMSEAIGQAKRVWLPHWNVSTQDPRGYWRFLLEQSGSLQDWTSFHGYDVYRYDLQTALHGPAPMDRAGAESSPLKGVAINNDAGALTVAAEWQPVVRYFDPAKVSLRLIDARGKRLSSVDALLMNQQGQTTDHWAEVQLTTNYYVLPIPPGTPPGTYTVTAQLYNARDVLHEDTLGAVELSRRLDTTDPYRTLAGYQWERSTESTKLPGLELQALALSTHAPWRSMPVDVTLRWRKTGPVNHIEPRLRLVQNGRVWNEVGSSLFERDYPIEQWATGETVIDRLRIDYPPMRGPIVLQIGQGDQWATLTTLQLDESQLTFQAPAMEHTQSAQFGKFAELLGYDLKSNSLASDRPLTLTLYWRAANTEPIATPYTVFTQILAPDGHLVAQHDAPPAPPTIDWVPGQVVVDEHSIKVVDPDYRGPATLIVGWYNSASVQRVPEASGGEYLTLQIPVRIEDE